jgi:uncharacterized protein (DUF488 family)
MPSALQEQRPLKLPSKSVRARAESKVRWNETRSREEAHFFTFGYEGRKLDELLNTLQKAGVSCVLDIRHSPFSMYRPEVSRPNLQRSIEAIGLQYVHLPEWGVPRDVRALAIESGTRDAIWEWYDRYVVAPNFGWNLHRFLNLGNPVAMMCVECDPTECHRHRISIALENQGLCGYDL